MRTIALTLIALAIATNACAQTCTNSSKPACIALVGSTAGVPDPVGHFTITVRDCANNPVVGDTVTVDFADCGCADVRPACEQPFPGLHVICGAAGVPAKIWTLTNTSGVATFVLLGAAQNHGNSPGASSGCARAYSFSLGLLGSMVVQAFDQDGVGGLGANDISAWLADRFAPGAPYYARSDYDCNNAMGSNDLSFWLSVRFANGSTASAASYCCPDACP